RVIELAEGSQDAARRMRVFACVDAHPDALTEIGFAHQLRIRPGRAITAENWNHVCCGHRASPGLCASRVESRAARTANAAAPLQDTRTAASRERMTSNPSWLSRARISSSTLRVAGRGAMSSSSLSDLFHCS